MGSSHRVTLTLVAWTGSEAGQGAPQLPSSSVSGTVCSRCPAESVLKEETSSGRGGERASGRVQRVSQGWAMSCEGRGLSQGSHHARQECGRSLQLLQKWSSGEASIWVPVVPLASGRWGGGALLDPRVTPHSLGGSRPSGVHGGEGAARSPPIHLGFHPRRKQTMSSEHSSVSISQGLKSFFLLSQQQGALEQSSGTL